jgi:hyperosmotically inducible periplasmic protein
MVKSIGFRSIVIVGATLVLAAACASTRTQKSVGEVVDDAVITTRVKTALIGDPATKARDIDVATFKGRVQLNGFVDSASERSQAIEVARKVNGVAAVDNNLKLKGAERSTGETLDDSTISVKVKAALVGDKRTEAHQIDVQTRAGVVLLGGFVNSAEARAAAGEVAKSVQGVAKVDNQITVK